MTYSLLLLVVLWMAWKVLFATVLAMWWLVDTFHRLQTWLQNRINPQPEKPVVEESEKYDPFPDYDL